VNVSFNLEAFESYVIWQGEDLSIAKKINALILDVTRSPFRGLGKPEPLKQDLRGWWSRRITGEHRLIYRVTGKGGEYTLEIAACRFHYGDR
jgi:toxin YoeB